MPRGSVVSREREIISDLDELEDLVLQMQYILACAEDVRELPADRRNDDAKVPGCLSEVWVDFEVDECDRFHMRAESDALIVKGVLGIVSLIVDGASVHEVARWEPRIEECDGLRRHLMRRRQGVGAVLERVRNHARRYIEESRS